MWSNGKTADLPKTRSSIPRTPICLTPVAQRTERLVPSQEAEGSSPSGGASVGAWRSLVAHPSHKRSVASSNLAAPTNAPAWRNRQTHRT